LPNIIRIIKSRRMTLARHVAHIGDMRNTCRILVGKLEGKKPLRRSRHKLDEKNRMALRKIGLGVWIGFIWLRMRTSG
jgi:hypothetical protein